MLVLIITSQGVVEDLQVVLTNQDGTTLAILRFPTIAIQPLASRWVCWHLLVYFSLKRETGCVGCKYLLREREGGERGIA